MPSVAHAQKASALAEADLIRDTWPGVIVHFPFEEPWGGAELVCGEPMTTRATAREALEDWLFEHGSVFGPGTLGFEVTHVTEWQETRTFMRFTQNIEGIEAPESYGRALAHKTASGDWALSYVRCAALNVPQGGLPERLVDALQAKAIAATQSDAAMEGLITDWTEPELVLVPGSAVLEPADPREARQVWELVGHDLRGRTSSVAVRIDAVTADIMAEWQLIVPFADDVSGSVEGLVLAGEIPYETNMPCVAFSIQADTTTVGIPRMRVELADTPSGAPVSSTYTDVNGDYAFTGVTILQNSVVRFIPEHEFFQLGYVDTNDNLQLIDPKEVSVPSDGLVPLYTYADNRPNPPMTDEYRIADMTAWTVVDSVRTFYKIDNQYIPGIDDDDLWVIPNETLLDPFPVTGAFYKPPSGLLGVPAIVFSPEQLTPSPLPNWAMATIISHEYGHFALDQAFGIPAESDKTAIHEGYSDVLAILHDETDLLGYATSGCTIMGEPRHGRDYSTPLWAWEPDDKCLGGKHQRSNRLVHAWRGIRTPLGYPIASDLFVKWSFLATPEPAPRYCFTQGLAGENDDLSARDATFYEVLVADDDDGALNNGTPNDAVICAAFEFVQLPEFSPYGPCPDSAGSGRCPMDFDGDGAFTAYDLIVLQAWAERDDDRADINRDGRIDLFDHLKAIEIGMSCE
ncbi:MAG: hypothetical protein NCW75_10855 [Phycisphaera sp.]|nr:MAG: hypothetical protein NCW75_10855 [Phycisphaera sp.]